MSGGCRLLCEDLTEEREKPVSQSALRPTGGLNTLRPGTRPFLEETTRFEWTDFAKMSEQGRPDKMCNRLS